MIKLFNSNALETTDLTKSYGCGVLSDAMSGIVTEELNGIFDLYMEYPVNGKHAGAIDFDMILFCKARPSDTVGHPFRIFRIGQEINGILPISAQHAFYDLNAGVMLPTRRTGIRAAVTGINNDRRGADRIRVWYDGISDDQTEFVIDKPRSLARALFGSKGSLQKVFGGDLEYTYDGDRKIVIATLKNRRGRDLPYTIRYGVNMTGLKHQTDVENTYTKVYAFYKKDAQYVTAEVPTGNTDLHEKILVIDLTNEFEETPSTQNLRVKAQDYISKNKVGDQDVSIDASFFGARKNAYGLSDRNIEIGDSVRVIHPLLSVDTRERIVKTTYNVFTDRYDNLSVGSTEKTAADTLAALERAAGM